MPALLLHATSHGFLHRSDRNVDAHGGRTVRPATEVRREIEAAVAALRAMGAGAGTRVAIAGSNGTRYLVFDIAVGLVGGVSVPLYTTMPPEDLDDVLRRSRAELLFVGAPAVMERLDELATRVPIVSFCDVDPPLGREIIPWGSFLKPGPANGDGELPAFAPVGPDDLATIRYTSGTTGPPKGVAFTHGQLRWMAETMASLVPWGIRTRPNRYLSFLPMSHVVEGILGTYSPYDLPAPVEVTFLEDFRRVASTLPAVLFRAPLLREGLGGGRTQPDRNAVPTDAGGTSPTDPPTGASSRDTPPSGPGSMRAAARGLGSRR
jgi:long-chain acyl-CoA synthetase